nr:hypothetical protein [Microcoleus sp. PH2017_14_LAR_D_A]
MSIATRRCHQTRLMHASVPMNALFALPVWRAFWVKIFVRIVVVALF